MPVPVGESWAAEIQPRSTVDTNFFPVFFLTLTRAEAHSSANPAPTLVPGAEVLSQWCADLVARSPSIAARPSSVCAPRPEFVAVSRTPPASGCRAREEFNMRTDGVR